MKERPILFSGPMVKALLSGAKTQTRRIVRDMAEVPAIGSAPAAPYWPGVLSKKIPGKISAVPPAEFVARCPYGVPGDRLWVRETWGLHIHGDFTCWNRDSIKGRTADDLLCSWQVAYAADATSVYDYWRPSILMPRWASRLTLEVVSVRVERLQDISEADAQAEGVTLSTAHSPDGSPAHYETHRERFARLWDSINGDRALWASNPWVWVVEFKRLP